MARGPISTPMSSIIFNIGMKPSLKMHAAVLVAISNRFLQSKRCFGAEFHTQWLKLSLLFCVFLPKHLSKRSPEDSSSYIGFKIVTTSSSKVGGCSKGVSLFSNLCFLISTLWIWTCVQHIRRSRICAITFLIFRISAWNFYSIFLIRCTFKINHKKKIEFSKPHSRLHP